MNARTDIGADWPFGPPGSVSRAIMFLRLTDVAIAWRLSACPPPNAEHLEKVQRQIRDAIAELKAVA